MFKNSIVISVPFYDDNSLESARQRENNKEQILTSFEAPYSSNGYETANSSKCLMHFRITYKVKDKPLDSF